MFLFFNNHSPLEILPKSSADSWAISYNFTVWLRGAKIAQNIVYKLSTKNACFFSWFQGTAIKVW